MQKAFTTAENEIPTYLVSDPVTAHWKHLVSYPKQIGGDLEIRAPVEVIVAATGSPRFLPRVSISEINKPLDCGSIDRGVLRRLRGLLEINLNNASGCHGDHRRHLTPPFGRTWPFVRRLKCARNS